MIPRRYSAAVRAVLVLRGVVTGGVLSWLLILLFNVFVRILLSLVALSALSAGADMFHHHSYRYRPSFLVGVAVGVLAVTGYLLWLLANLDFGVNAWGRRPER
ncbi:hypothetical protein [Corynebacterium halotolerans]|uniref:hypothetical protein n=1 Tax=Corynebacterium halotolerans TaxID=225326 RepID=UPI003CF06279